MKNKSEKANPIGPFHTIIDEGFAKVEEIGKGVYAVLSDPTKGPLTICNGGFIVGRESILVIEGYGSPAGAKWVVQAARKVSQVPIKAAILTHSHWDHFLGIAYYGGEGINVISHPQSRELIWENCLLQGQDKSRILTPLEEKVEKTHDNICRQHAQTDLDIMNIGLGLTEAAVHSIPNQPLKLEALPLSINLGDITATIEVHPGHAPDNIVVRVLDQNISFTGDLVCHQVYPMFISFDDDILRRELRVLASWGSSQLFVPGHGTLCGQKGILALLGIIDDLKDHAHRMFDQRATIEEAIHSYRVPEKYSDWQVVAWDFSIGMAIRKYYTMFKK
jgi:glyoxylase-like metal-dependent hydrolase (beta-lactamase superfamily II)